MDPAEKPLHVQVAEALGWTDIRPVDIAPFGEHWTGAAPDGELNSHAMSKVDFQTRSVTWVATIPRYDTDWAATGPWIEKYKIQIGWLEKHQVWEAWMDIEGTGRAHRKTPLEAVCTLIVLVHKCRRLPSNAS